MIASGIHAPPRKPSYGGPRCKEGDVPCGADTRWCPYFQEWLCSEACDAEVTP